MKEQDLILSTIRNIVASALVINESQVTIDSNLEDLGATSFDTVEIRFFVEEEFGFESDSEFYLTVREILEDVLKHCT